jgi:hypothetical protein
MCQVMLDRVQLVSNLLRIFAADFGEVSERGLHGLLSGQVARGGPERK